MDNALSPRLAAQLCAVGHDAVHVREYGLGAAPDDVVLERATAEARTLVSADTDFGALLAFSRAREPSIILFRGPANRHPDLQARLLAANLPTLSGELASGAIVVIEEDRVRVRRLPVAPTR